MRLIHSQHFDRLPCAVLLDLDNTLYLYQSAHKAAMDAVKVKVSAQLSLDQKTFEKAFDQAKSQIKAQLLSTAASHHRLLYMQRMLEIVGLGSQPLLSLELEQLYWSSFLQSIKLFDEVEEFLDDLRLFEIPSVIVSDLTAQIQFRKLIYLGLESYFSFIVTSEEAGFDKPHKAVFELALDKLNLEKNVVWMIGDDPIKDIKGAQSAIGAITLQKLHQGCRLGEKDFTPDAAFYEFKDLRQLIAHLRAK